MQNRDGTVMHWQAGLIWYVSVLAVGVSVGSGSGNLSVCTVNPSLGTGLWDGPACGFSDRRCTRKDQRMYHWVQRSCRCAAERLCVFGCLWTKLTAVLFPNVCEGAADQPLGIYLWKWQPALEVGQRSNRGMRTVCARIHVLLQPPRRTIRVIACNRKLTNTIRGKSRGTSSQMWGGLEHCTIVDALPTATIHQVQRSPPRRCRGASTSNSSFAPSTRTGGGVCLCRQPPMNLPFPYRSDPWVPFPLLLLFSQGRCHWMMSIRCWSST